MAEKKLVIGVAGRMGSGKSTVAHQLEGQYGFRYLRYSLVLADWFEINPREKTKLQELGWGIMSRDLQPELNRRLIERIDNERDCAVDGLRHPIDYERLKNQFTNRFFLIFVDAPSKVRFNRLHTRFADYDEFLAADSHPVESKIDSLKATASVTLPGTLSNEQLSADLNILIREFRLAS